MSYILEALRKADAERERGAVPDLHAQLLPPGAAEAQTEPPRTSVLPWLAVGVLLAIVAGGAWYLLGRDEPAAVAIAPPAPPAPPVAASAVPAASAPQAAASTPVVAASVAEPAAAPPPKPVAKAAPPRRPPPPRPPPRTEPPAARAVAPVRVPALGELPGELRQQVPQLVIGGSVYSPQASARMVVVNGQVFQEGSNLGPELKLEQIRQKAAVFSIRGQLFEVPF
jgi:general secretion pathway protein B